ncbi:sigma-54-dependent Fis family transcriptional regulator [Mucilaginibacter achroorhodeus]|uniref:Sigma-54-dependent Fis family transcriptional regulator n=1 Tax=Mucilaginibacter achroorhodeus TaxID=2599294 RepID=A0A563U8Z1_9SPHI|nr:sigma-54 dependent transcriptional regulator [Mucilaginibacter achroorhodeus]TWR27796.1 sigma-54-dependent Fis family transcriptional regulator [Mucilaginibacter achroorhodeus]
MADNILIIEDEGKFRDLLARIIENEGFNVYKAPNAAAGLKVLGENEVSVVISDVKLPDASGVELVKKIKDRFERVEVVVLTAFGSIKDCVKAVKNGAFDYIMKGDDNARIVPIVKSAAEKSRLVVQAKPLKKQISQEYTFDYIIGNSPATKQAVAMAQQVATTTTTVLLLGETGTGKEVFAQALHKASPRFDKPFVAVNCSSFSGDLLKSELFGHVAGSFTGALKDKKGLFEEADGGTLFLDEIGEMNLELQAQLLRVLENGVFNRVGEARTTKVNTRIIAATNRKLKNEAINGKFRLDLYYRLAVYTIQLPPLRQRGEDIKALTEYFANQFAVLFNKPVPQINSNLLKCLSEYIWPGNIRELRNLMERLMIINSGEELTTASLPSDFFEETLAEQSDSFDLNDLETRYIRKALYQTNGNKKEAAQLLGISLSTLYRKMEEYHI